jgi:hypothetical protein
MTPKIVNTQILSDRCPHCNCHLVLEVVQTINCPSAYPDKFQAAVRCKNPMCDDIDLVVQSTEKTQLSDAAWEAYHVYKGFTYDGG